MLVHQSNHQTSFYYFFCIALSFFIFFRNDALTTFMMHDGFNYYAELSKDIFHPNYILKGTYFSESMLLPLLGKLTGANATPLTYRLLCVGLVLLTPLVIAHIALNFFGSISKSLFFIVIFTFSFTAFWSYTIGTPDPLTILILCAAALQNRPRPLFILMVLACLSHFAISAIAGILLAILFASNLKASEGNARNAKSIIFGIIFGRILLQGWYLVLDYSPAGRFQWAIDHGIDFFIQNYSNSPLIFWLIPGIPFLVTYMIGLVWLVFNKRYLLTLAGLFSLAIAYLAMFFTVDGLRIFACIICGPYVYLLSESIKHFKINFRNKII